MGASEERLLAGDLPHWGRGFARLCEVPLEWNDGSVLRGDGGQRFKRSDRLARRAQILAGYFSGKQIPRNAQ